MKLSSKKLEALRSIVERRDESFKSVGALELRKSQQLNEAYQLEVEYSEIRVDLQSKYDKDVEIDMSDGSIVNATNDLKSV